VASETNHTKEQAMKNIIEALQEWVAQCKPELTVRWVVDGKRSDDAKFCAVTLKAETLRGSRKSINSKK